MNKIALEYQNNVRYIGKISENWKWNFVETIFCLFCIFNISYFFSIFSKANSQNAKWGSIIL